jgi:hypothetical protein
MDREHRNYLHSTQESNLAIWQAIFFALPACRPNPDSLIWQTRPPLKGALASLEGGEDDTQSTQEQTKKVR